ncbi:MAG: hypothetical protein ACM3ZQ_09620 [Bacillota bacterium]
MKTKWIAAGLGAVLVGGALFFTTPKVLANGWAGGMMGNGGAATQMMQSGSPMAQMMQNFGATIPGGNGADWTSRMHTPEMIEAMKNGTMIEYMNKPEVKEQFKNTPMGAMMYSPEMQEFMQSPEMQNLLKSDAFKKFQSSPQFQQMMSNGGVGCHGAISSAPGSNTPNIQPNSGGY